MWPDPAAQGLTSSQKLAGFSRKSCVREGGARAPCASGSAAGPRHSVWWVGPHLPSSVGLSPGREINPADTGAQPRRKQEKEAVVHQLVVI